MTSTPHSSPTATRQQHNGDSDDNSHHHHDDLLTMGKQRSHYAAHLDVMASQRLET
jgi:hypothetical protein